jgi:hypothetical protein
LILYDECTAAAVFAVALIVFGVNSSVHFIQRRCASWTMYAASLAETL